MVGSQCESSPDRNREKSGKSGREKTSLFASVSTEEGQ